VAENAPPSASASKPWRRRIAGILRGVGLLVGSACGLGVFGYFVNLQYPVKEWIFWVYAELWAYCLLFAVACFSAGHLTLSAARVRGIALRERLVMTLAVGVLAFFYLMFVAGLIGILRPWFAVTLPIVLIAGASRGMWRDGKRVLRHLRARRARGVRPRSALELPAMVVGILGVALAYYAILSPRNVAFDSHFYHLGLAQQYATEHAIRRFPEGWLPGALPHLASILYTWAYCLPGLDAFGKMVCASHVEFVLFVFTLASIPTLVRYLAPKAHAGFSWVAMFLFPGLFVYDSALSAAADHVAAFWAIPSYLAFRRAYRDLDVKSCVLLAACLSGAILTKYQAMYILAFPALALSFRGASLLVRALYARLRKRDKPDRARLFAQLMALGSTVLAGLVFTSAHWLKNVFFYGNPLFPYLFKVFPPSQWAPDSAALAQDFTHWQTKDWVTDGSTWDKFVAASAAMFSFSFDPHDWKNFHGDVPVFGSLFTLSLLVLPFVKGSTRRTWALSIATHLGVFIWFWTYHQDRYLQALVPWMAAVTAATLALAWQSGWPGKAAASLMVSFQLVWGGDSYLIPAHSMTKAAPINVTSELIAMGYKKKYEPRFKVPGALFDIGASRELPKDARVLLHENNPRLGIARPVVVDIAGWQYGIRYELFPTPADMHDKITAFGVTHIVSRVKKSRGIDSLGADLRFFDYIEQEATSIKRFGEFTLFALPASRPATSAGDQVAYLGCAKLYERGIHDLAALHIRDKQVKVKPARKKKAKRRGEAEELLVDADFAVTGAGCKPAVPPAALGDYLKIGKRGKEDLWARKRSALHAPDSGASEVDDTMDDIELLPSE